MITLSQVCKSYHTRRGRVKVLRDVDLKIQYGQRIGILGRNGAGKSTMIRIISGAEHPTSGTVRREMSVSWPLAFGGAFQGALTGFDNMRCICRIYGVDPSDKVDFVQEFSELGLYLYEPVKTYSSGMRARLAFAISMMIEFDCFLIDEIIAVGDARFHQKCHVELFEKRGERAMIFVSHDAGYIREHCQAAGVLFEGELHMFSDVDEATAFHARMQSS
jgi:capsular polysaccharide transport system ATP-binding protein